MPSDVAAFDRFAVVELGGGALAPKTGEAEPEWFRLAVWGSTGVVRADIRDGSDTPSALRRHSSGLSPRFATKEESPPINIPPQTITIMTTVSTASTADRIAVVGLKPRLHLVAATLRPRAPSSPTSGAVENLGTAYDG
jgi:hypothetical protein